MLLQFTKSYHISQIVVEYDYRPDVSGGETVNIPLSAIFGMMMCFWIVFWWLIEVLIKRWQPRWKPGVNMWVTILDEDRKLITVNLNKIIVYLALGTILGSLLIALIALFV